ncbi:PhzF family phenazine biosynthesis protein [Pseudomonas moorei]|nr:PhzF family phenazine biosynthesis protein [Pseudomonas moorei]
MEYNFFVVDVFSSVKLKGNPVMIVISEVEVGAEKMQAFSSWNGMPETVFLTKGSSKGKSDYSVRIFSSRRELPFAGHPSLGAAHVALELGWIESFEKRHSDIENDDAILITQTCNVGEVDIRVNITDGGYNQVYVKTPSAGRFEKMSVQDSNSVEIAIGSHRSVDCYLVQAGACWIVAKLDNQSDLESLVPEMNEIEFLSNKYSASGITVYAPVEDADLSRIEVRSFGPAIGVPEDAICGGGNTCVAVLENHLSNGDFTEYKAKQGRFVGRDGVAHLIGPVEDNRYWVGGCTSTVMRGTVTL